ncbi:MULTISPECIES: dihydrodipicolinate synthase family protein [unclassified Rothia (in: high G+C Gram-positive bacteria)]|uniref:dihydrodipicolinate synthase family protein n=1 Tax=unclassified Rothia (in: high G+C Gram-positive bacteria) TaxID=2689056 RepID=UPI00195876E5|nr:MULTISPECIES: dihydrodipicolinate synthase family protein [unclassified Rothia (in: high G+C Gram-positive bacteria)]MBM7052066.1 dihydrodipicolinate synthase family protein [Rothia sp. ZJ1223]QRZ61882.1 dihydrodipicolinate synthase family protein [Rothia sp. ZJ932]
MANPKFSGVIPPVLTPRTADGQLDVESLKKSVAHLIEGGVNGLFVLGSSGEVPYLTNAERETALKTVIEANEGRVPVIVGTNDQTTARVIDEAKRLLAIGGDAIVITSQYYALDNPIEEERHFREVAAAVDVPVFVYDVPVRTKQKLSVPLLTKLAREGVIVGVKDSSGDDVSFRLLAQATRDIEGFSLFTGHEVVCDGAMLSGAHGIVPGLGNVDPAGYKRLYDAAVAGDWDAARKEQDRLADLFNIVFVETPTVSGGAAGLGAFKTALEIIGVLESNTMSTPMETLGDSERERIRGIVEAAGLL